MKELHLGPHVDCDRRGSLRAVSGDGLGYHRKILGCRSLLISSFTLHLCELRFYYLCRGRGRQPQGKKSSKFMYQPFIPEDRRHFRARKEDPSQLHRCNLNTRLQSFSERLYTVFTKISDGTVLTLNKPHTMVHNGLQWFTMVYNGWSLCSDTRRGVWGE